MSTSLFKEDIEKAMNYNGICKEIYKNSWIRTEYTCDSNGCDFSAAVSAVKNSPLGERERSHLLLLIEKVQEDPVTINMKGYSYNKDFDQSIFYIENKTPQELRSSPSDIVGYVDSETLKRMEVAAKKSWFSRFWPWS